MDIDFRELLFGFSGRINRAKYWIAVAIYWAVSIALGLVAFLTLAGVEIVRSTTMITPFFIFAAVVYIAVAVSGIAVGIKRLHDRNKTGWWLLVFYLVPGLISTVGTRMHGLAILNLVSTAILIWMIVELGFLRGTPGPNRYGADPLPATA
jgi:uncharacterized membrane protein YhaH (DUF805 family)